MRHFARNAKRPCQPVVVAVLCLVHATMATEVSAQTFNSPAQPSARPAAPPSAQPSTKSSRSAPGGRTAPVAAGSASPGSAASVADHRAMPQPVREMLEAIAAAARTGRIEEMATAVDWNEMKPDLASGGVVSDPIAFWKARSADGSGREILAVLLNLIEATTPSVLPIGKDIENNRVFVWPGFADRPLASLSSSETVELYRLVPAAEAGAMLAAGRYAGWRLSIGADGTWHSFRKPD